MKILWVILVFGLAFPAVRAQEPPGEGGGAVADEVEADEVADEVEDEVEDVVATNNKATANISIPASSSSNSWHRRT